MEEEEKLRHLKHLIETLTTSGKDKLDEDQFKRVKKICKESDRYVQELFKILFKQLKKKHAEIRFSAFLICDEIFRRSHCFRELLLQNFKLFTNLVLGFDPRNPMPKPYSVSKKLKQKSVETLKQWYDAYGEGYISLNLGYKYLRDCKKVDFAELTARSEAERQRDEEERQRLENLKRKKIEKLQEELQTSSLEIKSTVMQLQNGMKLLIPDVHDFFIPLENDHDGDVDGDVSELFVKLEEGTEAENEGEFGSDYMRNHGIMKGVSVTVNLDDMKKVKETPDNEVVIHNLKELATTLKAKFLPQVKRWEETMRPYGEGNGEIIKQIVNLKNLVAKHINVFESVEIDPRKKETQGLSTHNTGEFDSEDDDDDFIEVPFDSSNVKELSSEAALLGIAGPSWRDSNYQGNDSDPLNQPSTSKHFVTQNTTKGTTKPAKIKKITDKCPDAYLNNIDLKPMRHQNPLAGVSQIWQAAPDFHEQDEMDTTGGVLGVATQRVNYEREWEPVKWACRAPLATGRLCPRKDRNVCPLHGPVVPRNDLGEPVSAEDARRVKAAQEQYERDHPAWQDPHLLAEIKAATGVDLKMPKGKAKRKRKYENLTDIRKTSTYERLSKKVLSRRAVRRVNNVFRREHSSSSWGSCNFNPS